MVVMAQALRGITGSYTPGTPWGSSSKGSQACSRAVHNPGGLCAQQGQLRTRVVGAHSRDNSKHRWPVRTAGTVQDTGSLCAQQGQFRTRGRSVRTNGTVQDTGSLCAHHRQFMASRDTHG
ncbi:unnamed protein product, partial [Staurois parvus]